jgi:hypothetical protein
LAALVGALLGLNQGVWQVVQFNIEQYACGFSNLAGLLNLDSFWSEEVTVVTVLLAS